MMMFRCIPLIFVFILIGANPIYENIRKDGYRQRRSLDFMNRHVADFLYRRFYGHDNYRVYDRTRSRQLGIPVEFRPVAGPINIEQLPAMLAARYVKRYPYSQRDDPALIGR